MELCQKICTWSRSCAVQDCTGSGTDVVCIVLPRDARGWMISEMHGWLAGFSVCFLLSLYQ